MEVLTANTLAPLSRTCSVSRQLSCLFYHVRLQCKANKIISDSFNGGSSPRKYSSKSRRALLWNFFSHSFAYKAINEIQCTRQLISLGLLGEASKLHSIHNHRKVYPTLIKFRYQKLKSGVIIQEIVEGQGPEANEGDAVEINYVCRRSNGYFVHSTVDQLTCESRPVIISLDGNVVIQGLKDVLVGMKVGGKRRALIPPSLGYVHEGLKPIPEEFGPRRSLLSHAKEPLVFEVQLLKRL